MSDRPSLSVIFNRTGTDKLWAHHYEAEYARHFDPIRDRPLRLLEIGIGGYHLEKRGGESLRAWEAYFPNATVHGLDIEDKSFLDGGRIRTHVGDQSSPACLERLNAEHGPFDVIIDDGSHQQAHIITSFLTLFPLLSPGGIYVIEDMATAYSESDGGIQDQFIDRGPMTAIQLLFALIDGLHWPYRKGRGSSDIDRMIKSIHVSKELAFVYKH